MTSVLDLNAYGFSKHEETINSSGWRTNNNNNNNNINNNIIIIKPLFKEGST